MDVVAGLEVGGVEDGVHLVGVGHHQPHERRAVAVRPADGSPVLSEMNPSAGVAAVAMSITTTARPTAAAAAGLLLVLLLPS